MLFFPACPCTALLYIPHLYVPFSPSHPEVHVAPPGAAAGSVLRSGWLRRRAAYDIQRHRLHHRGRSGVWQLPSGDVSALKLHCDAQERVRAVSPRFVHGAVEPHRQVSALRSVRLQPGDEVGVQPEQRLPVRVQTGILPQVRHVLPPQRVSIRRGSADPR